MSLPFVVFYHIVVGNLCAELGNNNSVDLHKSLLDIFISFATRAYAGVAHIFVEADLLVRIGQRHFVLDTFGARSKALATSGETGAVVLVVAVAVGALVGTSLVVILALTTLVVAVGALAAVVILALTALVVAVGALALVVVLALTTLVVAIGALLALLIAALVVAIGALLTRLVTALALVVVLAGLTGLIATPTLVFRAFYAFAVVVATGLVRTVVIVISTPDAADSHPDEAGRDAGCDSLRCRMSLRLRRGG